MVSLVTEASSSAFCQDCVLSLTSFVHLMMLWNFLEPFFFEENSLFMLSIFNFGTALLINGGLYFPFFKKI